jgi:Na+/proline symporter
VCVADQYGIPYAVTAIITLLFIWIYTRRSGIRTLVWTDVLQTFILLTALIIILIQVCTKLDFSFTDAWTAIWNNPHAKLFEFNDWTSKQHFWKQFLSGIFVVIVMTGLDQDMMQKNLTCKNLKAAQKDMCTYGVMFLPINLLFLALGILLLILYGQLGLEVPAQGDALLSDIVMAGTLGQAAMICFGIGIVASAFSSADSSMTALTTAYCIDILQKEKDERTRKGVHLFMMIAFLLCTLAFHAIGSGSMMDLIYTLVSYTYGPLLGLFAFGMFTKWHVKDKWVPYVAIASPIICYIIDYATLQLTGYKFGYEMLMFNGFLTFIGLWAIRCGKSFPSPPQKI